MFAVPLINHVHGSALLCAKGAGVPVVVPAPSFWLHRPPPGPSAAERSLKREERGSSPHPRELQLLINT